MRSKKPAVVQSKLGRLGQAIYAKAKNWSAFNNSKLGSPEFEKAASELLAKRVILPQIERVLIIPESDSISYFIFGYGDTLKKDLYVSWNVKTREIQHLPFSLDRTKKEALSTLETYKELKVSQQAGVPPWDETNRRKIYKACIEEIKGILSKRMSFLQGKPLKVKPVKSLKKTGDNVDLGCLEKSPSLKHASVILSRFSNASFMLLRDVFDSRNIITPNKALNEFLKSIEIFPQRQTGESKRVRYSNEEQEEIKDSIQRYLKDGVKKTLAEIVSELNSGLRDKKISPPSAHQIEEFKRHYPTYFSSK